MIYYTESESPGSMHNYWNQAEIQCQISNQKSSRLFSKKSICQLMNKQQSCWIPPKHQLYGVAA